MNANIVPEAGMSRTVFLRVDLDFRMCVEKGLPFLLDAFERRGIGATFLIVMGPDTMTRHKRRIKKKGYIKRLISMNPCKLALMAVLTQVNEWRGDTLVWSDPAPLERAEGQGHELGIHGYDHAWWADHCWDGDKVSIEEQVGLAVERFQRHFPGRPLVWGAPNWRTNIEAINVLQEYDVTYSSDMRGDEVFFPRDPDGNVSTIPQLPISLPCMHEMAQFGVSHQNIPQTMIDFIHDGYNQLCMHGYYEGFIARRTLTRFLDLAVARGIRFRSLRDALPFPGSLPVQSLTRVRLPGGFSEVSCSESFLRKNHFEKLQNRLCDE